MYSYETKRIAKYIVIILFCITIVLGISLKFGNKDSDEMSTTKKVKIVAESKEDYIKFQSELKAKIDTEKEKRNSFITYIDVSDEDNENIKNIVYECYLEGMYVVSKTTSVDGFIRYVQTLYKIDEKKVKELKENLKNNRINMSKCILSDTEQVIVNSSDITVELDDGIYQIKRNKKLYNEVTDYIQKNAKYISSEEIVYDSKK